MAARKKAAPKRGASRYQTPAKKPIHPLIWVISGLIIGIFAMSLFRFEPGQETIKREPTVTEKKPTPQTKEDTANKPKFEFYTLLSESEVIVPPEALPEKTPPPPPPPTKKQVDEAKKAEAARAQAILDGKTPPPPPPAKKESKTQFYLQAGSFPERSKAESVRAQLLLSGQNVHIEAGQVADKTWHRVLVGPFVSREQLAVAQKQLAANGFNNLLLQRKSR
ncbi:SPOR domain-containing protein [Denitrificimonas sp. JX-1]|uniref:SPOR domain-containing protein n=1 Tax=Denitrificimonas halotolerans TaxID=3098930 RepID=A0ABU5GSF7_9GAMM|nr:SPOR domain-containing protein [Denitrificimonas sp. JX-1]MDY7219285.1 SPOR domain-containing protein [Denitrificimonas sp. JX-1]